MKCPNDGETEMYKSEDYLDYCGHCGVERYAVRRNINDLVKHAGGVLDFSREKEVVLAEVSDGFKGLVDRAYDIYQKKLNPSN